MTYHSTRPAKALTNALERLMIAISPQDLEQNHALLCEYRRACELLGYDPAKGEGQRVMEPVAPPTPEEQRKKVFIEGVINPTVNNYMDLLNANDFDNLIQLFLPDGALQPPFQKPIVGTDAILRFFREDCQNLKLLPERGYAEPTNDGFNQIKVTGKVQTPWFGAGIGMNVAWRFLLNPEGKIYFVAIDLLASPAELLKFAR